MEWWQGSGLPQKEDWAGYPARTFLHISGGWLVMHLASESLSLSLFSAPCWQCLSQGSRLSLPALRERWHLSTHHIQVTWFNLYFFHNTLLWRTPGNTFLSFYPGANATLQCVLHIAFLLHRLEISSSVIYMVKQFQNNFGIFLCKVVSCNYFLKLFFLCITNLRLRAVFALMYFYSCYFFPVRLDLKL